MPDDQSYFKPAKREGVGLFVGIAGGTGSGKTFSALRLARGIVGPNGKIAAVDTEGARMSHYTDFFKFDVSNLKPPFRPERFTEAAKKAEDEGYDVLIIDSFSHEHSGEGGVLEWHDEEVALAVERAKKYADGPIDEDKVANAYNMRAWVDPKVAHKAMVTSFLQRRIPIIFCLRAEEKIKIVGNKPVPQGWQPICDKNFGYELTVMITLSNEHPGKVDYTLPRKIQEQHLALFPDGHYITEAAGAALAAWARGDDTKPKPKPEPEPVDRTMGVANGLIARIEEMTTVAGVEAIFNEEKVAQQVAWMKQRRADQYDRVMKAADDANIKIGALAGPETTPEPQEPAGPGQGE